MDTKVEEHLSSTTDSCRYQHIKDFAVLKPPFTLLMVDFQILLQLYHESLPCCWHKDLLLFQSFLAVSALALE